MSAPTQMQSAALPTHYTITPEQLAYIQTLERQAAEAEQLRQQLARLQLQPQTQKKVPTPDEIEQRRQRKLQKEREWKEKKKQELGMPYATWLYQQNAAKNPKIPRVTQPAITPPTSLQQ